MGFTFFPEIKGVTQSWRRDRKQQLAHEYLVARHKNLRKIQTGELEYPTNVGQEGSNCS